jgi:hypothetical protein
MKQIALLPALLGVDRFDVAGRSQIEGEGIQDTVDLNGLSS